MSSSLGEDLSKALFETEQFKGYVDSAVQNIAPLLTASGFDAFVPFISPLIIAGLTSQFLPKALKVVGQKIEIVDEQLQEYKKEEGSKAVLAKVASPVLGVLKKVIPAPQKELYEALSEGGAKLQQFLSAILNDDGKRKEFEENLKKFLTGRYENLDEFQREVKGIMGIDVDRLAIEAYSKFSSIIYNRDILDKLHTLEQISERDRKEIREKFERVCAEFNRQIRSALFEIEEVLVKELTNQQLLNSGLYLITSQTRFAKGETDCWAKGHFKDGDIKRGYDARRLITDKIIDSVDKNVGTIVYGRPHYGKTMILKRVMFELMDKGGYAIIFCEDVEANANRLVRLLQRVSTSFSRLLVIVDNAHRKGSEEIFVAFNNLSLSEEDEDGYHYYLSHRIRFLFAAREAELNTMIKSLTDRRKANDIKDAIRKLEKNKILLDFDIDDAILFVENALDVVKPPQLKNLSKENAVRIANYWYNEVAKNDPFVFVYALMRSIAQDKVVYEDFIESEMDEKINSLSKEQDIKAAFLCSFMGAFGIPISSRFLQRCGFYEDSLISLLGTSILFKNGEYVVRHELWALEFLVRIYSKMCNNSESTFDNRYGFGHIIQCVLKNIGINEWLNILYGTANFYYEQHFQPFAKIIISNFIRFAENLPSPADKAKLYTYGLGWLHYTIKDHSIAIAYYDKALEIEAKSAHIWVNKGVAYHSLGQHEDAIKCFDEALEIDPKNAYALFNKGLVLNILERYQEAIASYDIALEIEPDDVNIWRNKGLTLMILTLYRNAIECFDEALKIKQDYADALIGKGMALYSLAIDKIDIYKNREAIQCFDRALEIEPNNAVGRYRRAQYNVGRSHIDDGLADLEKAIDIDETLIEQAEQDFDILRNNERFTVLMKKSRK